MPCYCEPDEIKLCLNQHLVASRRRRLGRICSNIPRFEEFGNAVADVCSALSTK